MTHAGRPGVPVLDGDHGLVAAHAHSCLFCHRDYSCRLPHAGERGEMRSTPGACHPRGHRCCFACWARNVAWSRRVAAVPGLVRAPTNGNRA